MEFQDRILSCVDCGAEFVWTAGEQQFFADGIAEGSRPYIAMTTSWRDSLNT